MKRAATWKCNGLTSNASCDWVPSLPMLIQILWILTCSQTDVDGKWTRDANKKNTHLDTSNGFRLISWLFFWEKETLNSHSTVIQYIYTHLIILKDPWWCAFSLVFMIANFRWIAALISRLVPLDSHWVARWTNDSLPSYLFNNLNLISNDVPAMVWFHIDGWGWETEEVMNIMESIFGN